MVQDQESALAFYTEILGFRKMADLSMGEFRWLTVVSPDGIEGVELVLEPIGFEPAQVYQKAMLDASIPALALITSNLELDHQKLLGRGVKFRTEPTRMGPISSALFEDTCGNVIHLVQPHV